jgi:hypothetical protein
MSEGYASPYSPRTTGSYLSTGVPAGYSVRYADVAQQMVQQYNTQHDWHGAVSDMVKRTRLPVQDVAHELHLAGWELKQ